MKRQAIEDALTYALLGIIALGGVLNIVSYATPGYQTLRYLRARVRLERAGKIIRVPEATVDAEIARSATPSGQPTSGPVGGPRRCARCRVPVTQTINAQGVGYWMHLGSNGQQYTYCLNKARFGIQEATPG